MAVTGLPTNEGIGILSGTLREQVTKFCLWGTTNSSGTIALDETSTLASLDSYLVGEFDVSRAYFDDLGTLTFECPIPYDTESTKWVYACGLIHVDPDNGEKKLVALSTMPRFQKTAGIGGTVHYKVPIAGTASTVVFEELPYVTRQELDVVLNELHSQGAAALDLAGMANREMLKTLNNRIQSGVATITNRGVIKGCVASKSVSATRNLSVSNGAVFIRGQIIPIADMANTANVPSNTTAETAYSYAYLWFDGNGAPQIDCTELGASVPDGGIALYRVTVPSGSTEATDPYLASCTLDDVRVIEPNYPKMLSNAPFVYVALPYDMLGTDYSVELDVMSFDGGGYQMGFVYPGARASNGFSIYMNGTADSVVVRWTVKKTNL
ncbi:MAG: hypothetical protein PHV10_07705 [Sulfuricurvum sp.]|nr:hypothetical protein [Sulfuricurvum sp.]